MIIPVLLSRKRNFHNFIAPLIVCTALLLTGCKSDVALTDVYVKGKVVNPKSKFVVLTDYEHVNDTLILNDKNEFELKLTNAITGLYTLLHGNEYQSIYLEAGDSTLVFVDTKSFDESMSFSKGHASENNYLIELFADLEKSNSDLLAMYKHKPADFLKSLENSTQKHLKKLDNHADQQHFEKQFTDLAKDIIWYNTYSKKERYVGAHYSKTEMHKTCELPAYFYDHRKNVNLNETKLLNNYAFKAYINSLVSNLTLEKLDNDKKTITDLSSYTTKLQVTNTLIKNPTIKEIYLWSYTRNALRNAKDREMPKLVLDEYLKLSKHDVNKHSMKSLAASFNNLRNGSEIADLKLLNLKNTELSIKDVVNEMTIIYFWNSKEESYNMQVHHAVTDLRKKYPEMTFIGVNTDDTLDNSWVKSLNAINAYKTDEYKLVTNKSFNLQNGSLGNKRALLVDKNLTIIDGNINLLHYKIETTLLGYVSK